MFKIIIPLLFSIACRAQSLGPQRFIRDGIIYVTTDPESAPEKHFYPVNEIYQCPGDSFGLITDTSYSAGKYRLGINGKRVTVPDPYRLLTPHLMFRLMVACIDKQYIHCPCGQVFRLEK